MVQFKKIVALLLAGAMLLSLAACDEGTENSNTSGDGSVTTTTTAVQTTTTTTSSPTATPPVIPTIDGTDPLAEYMYTPDVSTIPFSIEAQEPGDPNFEVGKYYNGPTIKFRQSDDDKASFGIWIWDARVIIGKSPTCPDMNCDLLLDLMVQNGITDVYLHLGQVEDLESLVMDNGVPFSDEIVTEMVLRGFIKKCYRYGIRVEALVDAAGADAGRYLGFDGKTEYTRTKRYLAYVASFNSRAKDESERIYGIQFDVEADWSAFDGRKANIQYIANFFTYMRKLFDLYNVELDFCMMAWTQDNDMVVDEDGNVVNLMDVLTKKCHTITVMSYRPKASDQYSAAEQELEYGKKNGCRIIVSSETNPTDELAASERGITYWRIGAKNMSAQQTVLRNMLAELEYDKVGGAIHHLHAFWKFVNERP